MTSKFKSFFLTDDRYILGHISVFIQNIYIQIELVQLSGIRGKGPLPDCNGKHQILTPGSPQKVLSRIKKTNLTLRNLLRCQLERRGDSFLIKSKQDREYCR